MRHAIDELLKAGDRVEIVIVDDGSTDDTPQIADDYAAQHSNQVKVIHQVNGGHGKAIMTGLAHASGEYFKVVDSDDWLDLAALKQVLATLSDPANDHPDMLITNYVYDKVGVEQQKVVRFAHLLPTDQTCTWSRVHVQTGKYFLMHAVTFKTAMLKAIPLWLPEHTFYEDDLYVFQPLPYVKKLRYLDVDLYHYFIGRDDQSVNETVMIKRIDQQLFVNRTLIKEYGQAISHCDSWRLRRYMRSYVAIITAISSVLLLREGSAESLAKKADLWHFIRHTQPGLYVHMRNGLIGHAVNLPGPIGRKLTVKVYGLAQRLYGFN